MHQGPKSVAGSKSAICDAAIHAGEKWRKSEAESTFHFGELCIVERWRQCIDTNISVIGARARIGGALLDTGQDVVVVCHDTRFSLAG